MKNENKISSIIIAKDEEENIKRCIESQLNCIDDIVLFVDSSSTDRTFKIAEQYDKVRVFKEEWQGFAKTKQLALDKTLYDWVFWIDADEEITAELQHELNDIKRNESTNCAAFQVARRAFFLGKWIRYSGWYPGYVTRFFNKKVSEFNDKDVHEGLDVNGQIGKLKSDLNHYTDPSIDHYFTKFNRYTTLAAEELAKGNKKNKLSNLIVRPIFIFVKMYILRKGFLDGVHGFILAVFSAAYVFTKYAKLWELNKERTK